MFQFILDWFFNNKKYSVIYVACMVLICTVSIFLSNFFVENSFYNDEFQEKNYGFISEDGISYEEVKEFENEVNKKIGKPSAMTLATNDVDYGDDVGIMTYYIYGEDGLEMNYGYLSEQSGTCVKSNDITDEEIKINGDLFSVSGQATLWCAGQYASLCIPKEDYEKYNYTSHCVEFFMPEVLSRKECKQFIQLSEKYMGECEFVHVSGFSSDGFESVRNTLLISLLIFFTACSALMIFFEAMMYMQEKEIKIMRIYGATRITLICRYVSMNLVLFMGAYGVASIIAKLVKPHLSPLCLGIDGIVVLLLIFITTSRYVIKTIRHIDRSYKGI